MTRRKTFAAREDLLYKIKEVSKMWFEAVWWTGTTIEGRPSLSRW
jgi:hypothetical protein